MDTFQPGRAKEDHPSFAASFLYGPPEDHVQTKGVRALVSRNLGKLSTV